MTGAELDMLNRGVVEHLQLRERLMGFAKSHACWLDFGEDEFRQHGIDQETHALGIHISLASALVLYDNYLLAVSLYEKNRKLRMLLNREDSGYALDRNMLNKIQMSYIEPENRDRVRTAIAFYKKQADYQKYSEVFQYLRTLIEQSPSYNRLEHRLGLAALERDLSLMKRLGMDSLSLFPGRATSLFSSLFGNTAGLVETRHGKLFRNKQARRHLHRILQPGDILLEKTPFRLTDKLIPGHWGHAAVWIGSPADIKRLGLEENALVVKHRDSIQQGKMIVEALRSGVQLNSLKHFLNVDDVVVLRQSRLSDDDRRRIIIQSLRQLGKAYDFNFDVETTDRIVCSELVYLSHEKIQWPTSNLMGRSTISPDQIALRAGDGKPLKVVALYLDGRRVDKNLSASLASLQQ